MEKSKWRNFFISNVDRIYVWKELFPFLGNYLKSRTNKKVLNIGVEEFNIYDRDFFNNNEIEFYGLDKDIKIKKPISWKDIIKQDMTKNFILDYNFEIIIDYGVLGWSVASGNFTDQEIQLYIKNIKNNLTENGLYCLKIDYKNWDKNFFPQIERIKKILFENFKIKKIENFGKRDLIQNVDCRYETFILNKI